VLAYLLLLFVLLPLVELALLLWLAEQMGWLFTLGLVIFTGVLGASLARHQGLRCWMEVQRKLNRGELPADNLLDGLMILLAGAVLITPGVITDAAGFALLVPPVRRAIRKALARRLRSRMVVTSFTGRSPFPPDGEDVIDVDHRPVDDPE